MSRHGISENAGNRRYSDFGLYRRVLLQAKPQWPHILGIFLLSLLSAPLALLMPLPLKIVVDSVIGSRPLSPIVARALPEAFTSSQTALLLFSASLVVAITVLARLQELAGNLLRTYTGEKLLLDFRTRLFRHVQCLSIAYHDMRGASDSTYRIQYDAAAIQRIAMEGVMPFLVAGVTLLSMMYVTLRIDRQLALVALAICPFLYLLTRSYRRRLRRQSREVKRLESSAMSVVQEVLGAVRVVKAFGQEEREHGRFVRRYRESMWARIRLALFEGRYGVLIGVNIALGTAAVLLIGAQHVRSGAISLGELLLVMGYLAQIYQPMKTMSKKVASMQSGLASAERAFALLDEAPDAPEKPDARPLARATGAIEFRRLSFAYEKDRFVLEDISFDVSPGMRVGIAGTTGVGKTTLVSLLLRFYDPTKGQILLDGVDLRDYKLADLRNQFAIVLQEPVLFSASIAENIAYACPEAAWEDIQQAARAANAHDFIVRLPEGYHTPVGDRGMRLSGGERQRISVARAFLKNAPVLILDEPTSSVDVRTEAVILEALERLMHGRTTFIIAHRASTLRNCDLVLQMENGRFVDVTWAGAPAHGGKTNSRPEGIVQSGKARG